MREFLTSHRTPTLEGIGGTGVVLESKVRRHGHPLPRILDSVSVTFFVGRQFQRSLGLAQGHVWLPAGSSQ